MKKKSEMKPLVFNGNIFYPDKIFTKKLFLKFCSGVQVDDNDFDGLEFPCIIYIPNPLGLFDTIINPYKKELKKVETILILINEHPCIFSNNSSNNLQRLVDYYEDYKRMLEKRIKAFERQQILLENNLKNKYSFFMNSSIWIRLVKNDKEKEDAEQEMNYFRSIGLYDYDSAKENLEYNRRFQVQNYLHSYGGGHGNYITPMLYGNESEALEILCENRIKV